MGFLGFGGPAALGLGPFELESLAGRGGMAEVWRARHRTRNLAVAVKVLTAYGARDPKFRAALRNEVRLVAGLDHPNVVLVFDQGIVPPAVEAASGGRLVADSPYLVMEWASGGTLASAGPPGSWIAIRRVLLVLLDALAHAHARGVVHRDLKPGNVLLDAEGDARPGLKLADFGIARLEDAEAASELSAAAGTLAYMAPEQAAGLWNDQGPWTDLYALGCVAFWLATGAPPFRGRAEEIIACHILEPMPPLVPRVRVPAGFAPWVARLLEKDISRRFQCAADAAWALLALGDAPDADAAALEQSPTAPLDTEVFSTLSGLDVVVPVPVRMPSGRPPPAAPPRLAMPQSWRTRRDAARPSMQLVETGLGLYGLRVIPLVDRDDERDRLWRALALAADRRTARLVVLEGSSGQGKSRLASWLCERASELGAAVVLKATHSEEDASSDGIAAMIARHLRCAGAEPEDVLPRIHRTLRALGGDESDRDALAELVAPAEAQTEPVPWRVRFSRVGERHAVARRYLDCLAARRSVILWLDDVHWGRDSLTFALQLLEAQGRSPRPVLVLATVGDEALADRTDEGELLRSLYARDDVERIAVGALAPEHWPSLVRELLGLEGDLAVMVEQRAAGNPLFAVQLVGDWVQRDLLRPTERGFGLRQGASVALPEDLHAVWGARAALLLDGRPEPEVVALELAAVLGQDVDPAQWSAACARASVGVPWSLVEALLDRNLARADEHGAERGWSFAHAMLRETLERHAQAAGRLVAHHRACAEVLAGARGVLAERVGRHLLAAGDPDAAAGPLLVASKRRMNAGDLLPALALLHERDEALAQSGAAPDDARRCDGTIQMSMIESQLQRISEAVAHVEACEDTARRMGYRRLLALALVARARADEKRAQLTKARELCEEALAILEEVGDGEGLAMTLHWLGVICVSRGELDAALSWQEQALAQYERNQDGAGLAYALYENGVVYRHTGDFARSRELTERALATFEAAGMRGGQANAMVALGELAREEGDYDGAEELYRKALEIYERTESGNVMLARLNIGLARLGRRDYAGARPVLEQARRELEAAGWKGLLACAFAELLPCDASARDWALWDEHLAATHAVMREADVVDVDLAWAATLAGDEARAAGQAARAIEAYSLAMGQLEALGRPGPAAQLAASIAELRGASTPGG